VAGPTFLVNKVCFGKFLVDVDSSSVHEPALKLSDLHQGILETPIGAQGRLPAYLKASRLFPSPAAED